MLLSEGTQHKGRPFYIPECPRSGLPDFFKEIGFKVGAEVGVYKGKYVEKFCQRGIKMYAIDDWMKGKAASTQERADYLYNYSRKVLSRFNDCEVIKKSSMEAVKDFTYSSLDFVYLDADHSFKGIAEDLYEWYSRVRLGGVIAGHDYKYTGNDPRALKYNRDFCHVQQIVDAFIKAYNIDSFYTFGRSKPIELESKNDRYLSFMFFKL